MKIFKEYPIQDLIHREMECSCGRNHFAAIEDIIIRKDAIHMLPDLLAKYHCQKLFLVADENTYKAAGEKVAQLLKEKGFDLVIYIFQREKPLVPDEKAVGEFFVHLNRDRDIMIAVGAGTLNDLTKYVSFQSNIPYVIVATAPSMDGYSSFVAPLIADNLKTTYQATPTKAIIADISILKNAPMSMIRAGLGDMLGKYTGLCDWQLTRIINGEYYCAQVANLVKKSVEKCISQVSGIKKRDEIAMTHLTEGLILSGIAMSFIGNSRPASGSEHHLSHFLEMMFLFSGKEAILHGIKVGIATIAVIRLFHLLQEKKSIDFSAAIEKAGHFHPEAWEQQMKKIYRAAAPSVIALEEVAMKNSPVKHQKRIRIIEKRWPEIIKVIQQMTPQVDAIEKILLDIGAPINPAQVGIDADTFYNGLIYGKEVRNRYGILQLLWDLGLLEEFSSRVVDYFYPEKSSGRNSLLDREENILKQVKCFILDMDGTFYLGNRIFDGSLEFLESLKRYGKSFFFFTNNSSRNARYYRQKLAKMGCVVQEKDILTSNQVIMKYIKENWKDSSIYLVGNDYLREDFENAGIRLVQDHPDVVVVGFDTTLEYQRISRACHSIRNGVPFFAVNPDFNCPIEGGFLPDCGSICALITASTGVKPVVFGKPTRYTLQYILDITGLKEQDIVYIGDRLYTDIAMGRGNQLNTILVLSGETKIEDLTHSDIQPDLIFASLQALKVKLDEIYQYQ